MTDVLVIILTHDEARHVERAIASVCAFATRILVVDSGSADRTVALARACGAEVLHNKWTNYATQFNWALDQVQQFDGWVLRLDADEVVTPELAAELTRALGNVRADDKGIYVGRRMNFMGHPIRRGGLYPIRVLRLFRNGAGRCEQRWMDEHIAVDGPIVDFDGDIIDDNMKPLDWWTAKHNQYASREVIDILNAQYRFMPMQTIARVGGGRQDQTKRWVKERIYARLPGGFRAGVYFFYRFVLRLGFIDGPEGRAFHVLQGFWYRYLVDAKLAEVRRHIARQSADPVDAIRDILGVTLPVVREKSEAER